MTKIVSQSEEDRNMWLGFVTSYARDGTRAFVPFWGKKRQATAPDARRWHEEKLYPLLMNQFPSIRFAPAFIEIFYKRPR